MNKLLFISMLLIFLLLSGLILLHKYPNGLRRQNPCVDSTIKDHVLSLTSKYSEKEKQEFIPEIKKKIGCV